MQTIRLDIAYDGSNFAGWQTQAQKRPVRTVQQTLEEALRKLIGQPIALIGAARTDSGVHAIQQVGSLHDPHDLPLSAYNRGLNTLLPHDVRILAAAVAEPSFNARKHAVDKTYEYYFSTAINIQPVVSRYSWVLPGHYSEHFSLELLDQALALMVGKHDFSSFCAKRTDIVNKERTVFSATRAPLNVAHPLFNGSELHCIQIRGDGFLKQMVRNIVGTVLEVARGKTPLDDLRRILAARNRIAAGPTAPAQGLFLTKITY